MNKEKKINKVNNLKGLEFINTLRNIDDTLDTTAFGIFLFVCSNEGISNDDIVSYFKNMHKARVSRGVHILCKTSRFRKEQDGSGLIYQKIDPQDFRKRSLFLTESGKRVRDKISKLLG
jgi:hypothetical protein